MNWKRLLESAFESVNDSLRLRNDYLIAENRILRNQIHGRVQLTNNERKELAEIGAKLGKKTLEEIATTAKPDTILAWSRKFANDKVDTTARPKAVGHPHINREVEDLVIRIARENRSWGYDRIQGALNHLGYIISDQTVGNIFKRHGIRPAPERKKTITWREFIRCHLGILLATDFFSHTVWRWVALVLFYLLSFIHFSRHPIQMLKITLNRQILTLHVRVWRSVALIYDKPKWAYFFAKPSRPKQAIEAVLAQTVFEFKAAEKRWMRSQDSGKVMVLLATQPKPIRDGPHRHGPRLDHERKAA